MIGKWVNKLGHSYSIVYYTAFKITFLKTNDIQCLLCFIKQNRELARQIDIKFID